MAQPDQQNVSQGVPHDDHQESVQGGPQGGSQGGLPGVQAIVFGASGIVSSISLPQYQKAQLDLLRLIKNSVRKLVARRLTSPKRQDTPSWVISSNIRLPRLSAASLDSRTGHYPVTFRSCPTMVGLSYTAAWTC